jgi:hypothetical protein
MTWVMDPCMVVLRMSCITFLSRMPTEFSLGSSGSELDVSIVPIVRHQDVVSFEV